MVIYESQRDLLQGDLDRGWGLFQLFVPLALTPFAAVALVDDLTPVQVLFLGTASCSLLLSGHLMMQRLSRFQYKTWTWIRAIEAEVGLPGLRTVPEIPKGFGLTSYRVGLIVVDALLWVLLAGAVWRGLV